MAPTLFGGQRGTLAVTLGNFATPHASMLDSATEANKTLPVRVAGTVKNFTVNVDANGTARAIALRKNSADSALVISPTNSTAGQFKSTATDHWAIGDTMGLQFRGTAPAYIPSALGAVFYADTGTASQLVGLSSTMSTVAEFIGFSGHNTTEANSQFLARVPATYKNMTMLINVGVAASVTFTSRKNGANGNMSVTVGSGLTGAFEDTTHNDAIVSGDKWCISFPAAIPAGMNQTPAITAVFTGASSDVPTGINIAQTGPDFIPMFGGNQGLAFNESDAQLPMGIDGQFTNLRSFFTTNSITVTITIVFRKNGVNGNQTFSVAAGVTGAFEDTTHTDSFLAADLCCLEASGSINNTTQLADGYTAQVLTPRIPFAFPKWPDGDFATEIVAID